ncbi:MAG: LysM peptidoglycan-binding domain-containing protein [Bacteroidota bacterium]
MSATQVFNALNGFLQTGPGQPTIDLWTAANGSTDLSDMVPMLGLFGISTSYVLTEASLGLSPDGGTVTLSGDGTFAEPGNTIAANAYNISGTLVYTESNTTFTLSLAVTSNWSFSQFFQNLPETFMQNPDQVGLNWQTSVLTKFTISNAIFSGKSGVEQQLLLNGSLLQPDDQFILDKTIMVGNWPLPLSGTVDMPTVDRNYPLLELDAQGNGMTITGTQQADVDGPATLPISNPGLTLVSTQSEDEYALSEAFTSVELFGDFALGSLQGRLSVLILSTGDVWSFSVDFQKETTTLVQGLSQLTSIFGVDLPVPMNFPLLSDFYVSRINVDLQVNTSQSIPTFSMNSLSMTIQSDKEWNPPVPFVTVSDVGIRWVWSWSMVLDESGQFQKINTLNGAAFGTLNFGSEGDGVVLSGLIPDPNFPATGSTENLEQVSNKVSLRTTLLIPDFIINGYLTKDSYIPIGKALQYFFGSSGPSTGLQTMNITSLTFSADPLDQNYYADANILFGDPASPDAEQGWRIDLFVLTIILNQLEFYVQVLGGKVSGGISGVFFIDQGDPSDYTRPRIVISAEYPTQNPDAPEGWRLSGSLYPGTSISVTKLVYKFIYGEVGQLPQWVPDIAIDRLMADFTTGSGTTQSSYKFGGTVSARWQPNIFNTTLKINASASVDVEKPSTSNTASGSISGSFSVNKLAVTASLTFGVPEPTYQFKVQFDQLWLTATTSWREGKNGDNHQVLSLQLGGVTLGDMLEYLVNLAAPTLGFQLDSPWDALKKVDLSQFVLTIDPKENIVEFVFNADVDLVVAKLDSIGVRYSRESQDGKVDMILTGSFLGQNYGADDPLTWDVINDPPPAVPGKGQSFVDLRYLGIGQHVTFSGETTPATVAESIAKLRADMQPPDEDTNPLDGQGLVYSSESEWLIGLDLTLIDTLDLSFIFNDPKLYGLSIALSGERAGSLAGLRFEILYKKITDDIGMFRIEFQVPELFRTIQLGAVSLTLGIIVIEIYTNGNFKVDFGFPYNRDFDRSFSLQAAIFIGRGGFYLGVLNGDTSTQVPRITNGDFSPVIELGIGISAGVGREIKAGILSGGAYVQLEVIFQGVLAWFNPSSNGTAPAQYFKCQAMAAIHGKVYGSVDFSVIKVSVTLEAYAQASITYESYQPMLIEFKASVSAKASVKVLFVKVHFSFKTDLKLNFTVGSAQPTPWIINSSAGDSLNSGSSRLVAASGGRMLQMPVARRRNTSGGSFALRRNRYRRNQVLRKQHFAGLQSAVSSRVVAAEVTLGSPLGLNWQPDQAVFPDAPRTAHLTLLPVFTIADVPLNWNETVPANPTPNYRSAMVLFADTGIAPDAQSAADCSDRSADHSAMATDPNDTSTLAADILTQGLVQYAINALPRSVEQGNTITAGQLELLVEALDDADTMATGFSINSLAIFFSNNIHLSVSGDPNTPPNEKGAMVVPMPPFLQWTSTQIDDVNFANKNEIGTLYEWGISQLLKNYFPVGADNGAAPTDDNPTNYESFTSFMFRDFCLMLVKNALQEMQKLTSNTEVTVQEVNGTVQNLVDIANGLPSATVSYTLQSGDTLASVAEALGATIEELQFLNPNLANDLATKDVGTSLDVIIGVPPEVIALDNSSVAFAIDQCDLGTLVYQTKSGNTLRTIANLFQIQDVATLLDYNNTDFPVLSTSKELLLADATFDLSTQTFNNAPADFDQLRTAGTFFVRYSAPSIFQDSAVPEMASWYVQAITGITENATLLNGLLAGSNIASDVELPPGQTLTVPNTFQIAYNNASNRNNYTTVNGDTLLRIGYALVLQQDFANSDPNGVSNWQSFQGAVRSSSANTWSIPAAPAAIAVLPGEDIVTLVRRLIVGATWTRSNPNAEDSWTYNWPQVAQWMGEANILAPLAAVTVPQARTAQHNPLSFDVITQTYGLSIEEATDALLQLNGLYSEGTTLQIKLLPAQDISVLINQVLQGDSFPSVVNQSSRMLMAGLQLPGLKTDNGHTVPDPDNPLPLYDLTGQQFDINVNSAQPTATAFALQLASNQSWITLMESRTVNAGDSVESLETEYPDLLTYNPGLTNDRLQTGMVVLTEPADSTLNFSYTNQQVIDQSPASGLNVVPIPPTPPSPEKLPISGTVLRTYGLEHRIELQTPVPLPIPTVAGQESVNGNPSLWMFPEDFLQQAIAGVTTLYEVLSTQKGEDGGSSAQQQQNATYGMLLPFKMKQLNSGTEQFSLLGVDTENRQLLLALRTWLLAQQDTSSTQAFLLLSPAPNASNTSGLTVLTPNPDDTYIIKSNLSTESAPPSPVFSAVRMADPAAPNSPLYAASLSALTDFTTLLWEGSVVGGTGFYFDAGQELPGSAIDEQGNITLQLLVIAGTQQALAPDGRALLPFNNCALLGPGLNAAQQTLYIESADGSETITQALVPPGNIGFQLLTNNPSVSPGNDSDAQIQLKELYSLLTFAVNAKTGSPFVASASGLPVMPGPSDGTQQQPWEQEKDLRNAQAAGTEPSQSEVDAAETYHYYKQVLPVARFVAEGTPEAAAQVVGLPDPSEDPYRGYGMLSSLPSAEFAFGFGDVLGNRTQAAGANQGITEIEVGYTDNLIGLSEWPAISSYFEVQGTSGNASLRAVITYRSSELVPSPSQSAAATQDLITQNINKYRAVYYQLVQSNITAWIVSSLKVVDDPNYSNRGLQLPDVGLIWKFVAGAYVYASALSKLNPAQPTTFSTLDAMITTYGIRYTELAQANADTLLQDLFGSTLPVVPAYYPYVENQSISTFYGLPPNGWPKPATAADLLKASENQELPLRSGTAMVIPTQTLTTGNNQPTKALQTLAAEQYTQIEALASENAAANILAIGFEFTMEVDEDTEMVITVTNTNNNLNAIVAQFVDEGVNTNVIALAQFHQAEPGMLATGVSLSYSSYVVQESDTLASNSSGLSSTILADSNVNTANLFDPGALIYFGQFANLSAGNAPPTLQEFANQYACPIEQLLKSNAAFNLPATSAFVLPGTLAWPAQSEELQTAYTIMSTDTLDAISAKFSQAPGTNSASVLLAQLNENMPDTLLPQINLTIAVGGQNYQINTGNAPTFASTLSELQLQVPSATMDDVVNAIGSLNNVLNTGALLLCPPAQLGQDSNPSNITASYGVDASSFALANAAMQGLIVPGLTLYTADGLTQITTQENDTFNTLTTRFADQNVQVSIGEIMTAGQNQDTTFLKAGAIALLPPPNISASVNIGSGGPYASPINPLQVSLRLVRPATLIYPDFRTNSGTGPVEMVESPISAPAQKASDQGGLTFNTFVNELTTALPNLRVGTAQVSGVTQDLWFVNFGTTGIHNVTLGNTDSQVVVFGSGPAVSNTTPPNFFALTPLYQYLVSRQNISIQPLNANGQLGDATLVSFQNIDVEMWARKFVEDFDRFLSGPFVTAIYDDEVLRQSLTSAISSKQALIPLIAEGLDNVLDIGVVEDVEALTNAKAALKQKLGVSLAKAYEASVLVQYNSSIDSAWQETGSTLAPAALYGNGKVTGSTVPLTITAAKTQLADTNSYVNFLVTLNNPPLNRNVQGAFEYEISHLEFNISDENVPAPYQASDWLTFVPLQDKEEKPAALMNTDPGAVDIPIPLRTFPDLPIIIGQSAEQSSTTNISSISDLSFWEYTFTYSHQHAEQDAVMITAEFNLAPPQLRASALAADRDLFTELAQYNEVATPLWKDLNALIDTESTVDRSTIQYAVATFAQLASNVSEYWGARIPPSQTSSSPTDDLVAQLSYNFESRVMYREDGNLDSLTLISLDGNPGPNGTWPVVYIKEVDDKFHPLEAKTPSDNALVYEVPETSDIPATAWPIFKIVWENLNIGEVQNARTEMWVERNQGLLEDVPTNPRFLFATDRVLAASVVTPLNNYSDRVYINSMGSSLTEALNATFSALFATALNEQQVTMELSYGFELVGPAPDADQGLVTYQPIGLYPNQTLSAATGNELNTVIENWKTVYNPSTTGGEWVFSLKLYSRFTTNPQVVLTIDYMVYKIV